MYGKYQTNGVVFPGYMINNKQIKLYYPRCMENNKHMKLYSPVCMVNNKQMKQYSPGCKEKKQINGAVFPCLQGKNKK